MPERKKALLKIEIAWGLEKTKWAPPIGVKRYLLWPYRKLNPKSMDANFLAWVWHFWARKFLVLRQTKKLKTAQIGLR